MKGKKGVFLILYLTIIVFITVLIREWSFTRGALSVTPFRMIDRKNYAGILLNIALFIPLGFFLADIFHKKCLSFLNALFISLAIELIQYNTGRGQFDIDDLICNGIGSLAGIGLWMSTSCFQWKRFIPHGFLIAGIIGCFIVTNSVKSSFPMNYTGQFDFHINSANVISGELEITGTCKIYNRSTPDYQLFLDDALLTTEILDDQFITSGSLVPGKHELIIHFHGYGKISTGTYLRIVEGKVSIEYVPGDVSIPFSIPEHYILKAYNSNQPTYVFEDLHSRRIVWYIGWDISSSTDVIYHIQTDEPEKLPESRVQYGFDNRGFKVREENKNELDSVSTEVGMFSVFEREIPAEYNVTAITVGYNTSGTIPWVEYFRVE